MRRPLLLFLLAAGSCAAPRAQKMSFEELYSTTETREPSLPAPPRAEPASEASPHTGARKLAPEPSPELQTSLDTFAQKARGTRGGVRRGAAMPAEQAENWEVMNRAVDLFLSRAVEATDSRDLAKARGVLEAELEQDGRTYGDMPGSLAEAVVLRVGRLAVRAAELRRLGHPPEAEGLPKLSWPVEPVTVTSVFGQRWHPVLGDYRRHQGVDLAAREGQVVHVAAPGVVLRAGWNGDHGIQVEVQHAGRWLTRYSHLSRMLVEPGEILEPGDAVGMAGETGLATGVHLHLELWRDGEALDPLDALEPIETEGAPSVATHGEASAPEATTHQGRRPVGQRP